MFGAASPAKSSSTLALLFNISCQVAFFVRVYTRYGRECKKNACACIYTMGSQELQLDLFVHIVTTCCVFACRKINKTRYNLSFFFPFT